MNKTIRQQEILQQLQAEQTLTTEDMAQNFQVSIETIRRDINDLEKKGLVKKVYGGITLSTSAKRVEGLDNWHTRAGRNNSEKVRIAHKALDLIPDNSVIALDIGTTIHEFAKLLGSKSNLSIVTNSLPIACELAQNTTHHVYAIGGLVMPNEAITSGSFARKFLKGFASIDFFITSADGLSLQNGITEFGESIADVKQQMLALSSKTIALIDHSKFGREALFKTCELSEIDVLVTNAESPKRDIKKMRELGIEVIIAE